MELANSIEAILFYQAEPVSVKRLATLLKKNEGEVRDAIGLLRERLLATGLRLLENNDEVMLGTSPDASILIEAITKEELSKDLSKSALETLAIVLYQSPITRAEIDYIRGVNSNFILRNLLVRGLVEKVENPTDQRSFLYKPTFQLLEYMGVTRIQDLPEYETTISTLSGFVASKEDESSEKEEVAEKNNSERQEGESDTAMTDLSEEMASDLDADIAEEDQAGPGFDDEQLQEHRELDENNS